MSYKAKKTKICFIIDHAYPLFNRNENSVFGGAEINLYNLSMRLSETGRYDITFLVGDYGQQKEEVYSGIKVRKIKYLNLKKYNSKYHKIMRQFMLWKELIFSKADVYITSTACELLGWLALIVKKLKGKKIIFRLASDSDVDLEYWKHKGKKFYSLYKYGIYNSDLIVSQTEKQKKLLKDGLNLESTVIKNGFFINTDVELNKKKYILWVSRGMDIKRPELFVELARRLPEENFLIIMSGDYSGKAKIVENAAQLKNIRFIDYVPFFEIQKYYEEAKLFVNTSEFEGFPNSFIQACLAKTPILSFRVNPDNFIDQYELGYCCNDSVEKAIDFIKKLNQEKIRLYGENALNYVKQHHDINESAKKYEALIS
ncbi:MAG: glycosyltransferase family 4 protein [Clostridia bacterium]|nr:glycosyltransferase family 4 protein [Clostridia bacterium]